MRFYSYIVIIFAFLVFIPYNSFSCACSGKSSSTIYECTSSDYGNSTCYTAADVYQMTVTSGEFYNSSTATLSDLIIQNNSAEFAGGGIWCYPNAGDVVIDGPFMSNIIVSNNSAGNMGGGIALERCNGVANNILIHNNTSSNLGGGLYFGNSNSLNLNHVTITNNQATNSGSGLYLVNWTVSQTLVNIENSIIWDEISLDPAYVGLGSNNCDVSINYSNILGGWEDGMGNINLDPLFNEDYTLQSISPCIDAGDPNSEFDPNGTVTDMGAFYFESYNLGDITLNGSVDIGDVILMVEYILEISELSMQQLELGDFNLNGIINVTDIVLLLEMILDS